MTLWGVGDPSVVTPTAVDARGKRASTWAQVKAPARPNAATVLLPNYPNPFNPETWIPFDLRDDARVTISIHDGAGRVVRRLDLGERGAGAHRARDRAAYWDGRNQLGELVSSGLYFVEIAAGSHRATGRISLQK